MTTGTSESGDRVSAVADLLEQASGILRTAEDAMDDDLADDSRIFDLAELKSNVAFMSDKLARLRGELLAALDVYESHQPVALYTASLDQWGGPQPIRVVNRLAEIVIQNPQMPACAYADGRRRRFIPGVAAQKCQHSELPCNGNPVRRADGTRTTRCWSHLPEEERAAILVEREVVKSRPCPLCQAGPDANCTDSKGAETTPHNERLRASLVQGAGDLPD